HTIGRTDHRIATGCRDAGVPVAQLRMGIDRSRLGIDQRAVEGIAQAPDQSRIPVGIDMPGRIVRLAIGVETRLEALAVKIQIPELGFQAEHPVVTLPVVARLDTGQAAPGGGLPAQYRKVGETAVVTGVLEVRL